MTDTPEPAWQTQVEIEAVAQRFEEQIRRGDRDATIQAMLAAHRHLPRHGLFQALLESELDVRQPHASENDFGQQQYLARFPDLQSVVQAVFAKESSRQPSEDGLFTEPGDAADKARNTLSDLPQTPRYLTNPADVLSPGEEVGGYRI